ncbi:hypothetical protein [Paenibacillus sp. SI8]|uniref:hypothetical protein n=1 Tax=unclassified Paenibacillus TaxID=185978 RepID=UPI00346605D0
MQNKAPLSYEGMIPSAVILNCWNEKLGEIQFDNAPAVFPDLLTEVNGYLEEGMRTAYGLEDT